MRGLVTLPGIELGQAGAMTMGSPDPQKIRIWTLFWDEIASAETGLIRVGDMDLDYLKAAGIVREYMVETEGGEASKFLRKARADLFERLEKLTPGSWALGVSPGDELEDTHGRALRFKLAASLPVPNQDVPLAEILSFRAKRHSECEAIMSYIDEAYLSVVDCPDKPLAEHVAIKKIAGGAADHLKSIEEAGFAFRLIDLIADYNLLPAAAAMLVGAQSVALGADLSSIVGNTIVAGGNITIGQVAGAFKRPSASSPFRYVVSYHQEVFRPE